MWVRGRVANEIATPNITHAAVSDMGVIRNASVCPLGFTPSPTIQPLSLMPRAIVSVRNVAKFAEAHLANAVRRTDSRL